MPQTRQKYIETKVDSTVIVEVDGKWTRKTVSKSIQEPQWKEVDLYDEAGKVIGKHNAPIMEQYGTFEKQNEWEI